ncbi:MAG: AraC family transcriptional regulator [Eubacteriaceae bacterium]|jgi:AraC-like DNA-binding protein/mannose-6-phosphate isomerase-like protein (cupin superfamily)|nr:AraC family transcriptional regulator [Eubacteriaceae bacterium]
MQIYDIPVDSSHKETTGHGTEEFRFALYDTRISSNILGRIVWHWHDELQFCTVLEGIVDFHVRGDMITVGEGEGIFINVGQLHEALNHPGSSGRYMCVDFHPDLISGPAVSIIRSLYVRPYITENSLPYLKIERGGVMIGELLELAGIYEKKEKGYEIDIEILLLQIWKRLIASMKPAETDEEPDGGQQRIKEIIRWIDAHYTERFDLSTLAGHVGLSKSYCCREFKKRMNCTISDFLLERRLSAATEMLTSSDDPVTEIAYSCGFGSTSYFIEKFRTASGCTPLTYRKKFYYKISS